MFKVRKKYVVKNRLWECLAIRGDYAWLVSIYEGEKAQKSTAYVWSHDGKSVSLSDDYDIDFAVTELVEEDFA
jgi:hypothetical protein